MVCLRACQRPTCDLGSATGVAGSPPGLQSRETLRKDDVIVLGLWSVKHPAVGYQRTLAMLEGPIWLAAHGDAKRQCGSAQFMLVFGTPSGFGSRVLTGDSEGTVQKASADTVRGCARQFLVQFGSGKDVKHHSLPPLAANTIELRPAQVCVREPLDVQGVTEAICDSASFLSVQ